MGQDLNLQPAVLETAALPIELPTYHQYGPDGDRTRISALQGQRHPFRPPAQSRGIGLSNLQPYLLSYAPQTARVGLEPTTNRLTAGRSAI